MSDTLLDQFVAQECTPYVRDILIRALEAARSGVGPWRHAFEFNRFEVTIDVENRNVILEDVLDPTDAGAQCVPIDEFRATLLER